MNKTKKQNICFHKKINFKIKNIIFTSIIIAISLFLNMFHIPFSVHGIELEKIEFGIIVLFSLIGIINIKIILIAGTLIPFLDSLLHGHYLSTFLIESVCNFLIILFIFIFYKIFLDKKKYFFKNIFFLFFSILTTMLIRTIYYYFMIFLFIESNDKEYIKIIVWLQIVFIVASIKYFIIFLITILIKNKLKNIKFYDNN